MRCAFRLAASSFASRIVLSFTLLSRRLLFVGQVVANTTGSLSLTYPSFLTVLDTRFGWRGAFIAQSLVIGGALLLVNSLMYNRPETCEFSSLSAFLAFVLTSVPGVHSDQLAASGVLQTDCCRTTAG